ncbi:hypothetical protein Pfo_008587, partial [Paulownia fortunei]
AFDNGGHSFFVGHNSRKCVSQSQSNRKRKRRSCAGEAIFGLGRNRVEGKKREMENAMEVDFFPCLFTSGVEGKWGRKWMSLIFCHAGDCDQLISRSPVMKLEKNLGKKLKKVNREDLE